MEETSSGDLTLNKHIERSIKHLDAVQNWIGNCDTKSSFLFTFYGVIITIIFTSDILDYIVAIFSMTPTRNINFKSVVNFTALVVNAVFIFSAFKVVFHVYNTLRARTRPEMYTQSGLKTNSVVFFNTISRLSFNQFESEINNLTQSEYLKELNSQLYINSNIATEKFEQYNKSLYWVVVSFASLITFLVLYEIIK